MAALDVDAFRSKQFVFVIGEAHTEFTAHAAIIAKQSKALNALINGSMKEASDGKAIFEDIGEETFIRFCQFAYAGDYITPDFTAIELPHVALHDFLNYADGEEPHVLVVLEPDPEPELEPELELEPEPDPEPGLGDDGWGMFGPKLKKPKKPKKQSKRSRLWQSLHDQVYNIETTPKSAARCEVRQNSDPSEDYTPVFLGHAQLYVFAEKWGIESLKTLTLFKLHKTLTTFTLYKARRLDIVKLLQYAFSNINTPDLVHGVDELRSLVMLYTACEVESLMHCPELLQLIGDGGHLAQYLVQMLMQRIS